MPVRCQIDEATERRPPFPCLVGDSTKSFDGLLLVRLVGELLHSAATLGVIADRAGEQHDSTAVGPHRPRVRIDDGQLVAGQGEPVVAVEGSLHVRDRSRDHRRSYLTYGAASQNRFC